MDKIFINRQDLSQKDTFLFVCVCHFQDKYLNRENGQRTRLKSHLNPVPTIHPESITKSSPSLLLNLSSQRKAPKERIFQPDEINSAKYKSLHISNFSDINESNLRFLDKGYNCSLYEDHAVFYKTEINDESIPKVTECIRINKDLHVQLFFIGIPLPLPPWFREGNNCKLKSLTQLENFPAYIRSAPENLESSISEEL